MKKKYSYIVILSIVIVAIVIDLVSKSVFADIFADNRPDISVIGDFFTFTFLKNTGAAFGIFSNNTLELTIVSVIFVVGFVVFDYFYHSNSWWYLIAFAMIVSGAIGNLVDRIFLGYVRDFINISLFSFVFNLADLFITIGVICFMVYMIREFVKELKQKKNGTKEKESK